MQNWQQSTEAPSASVCANRHLSPKLQPDSDLHTGGCQELCDSQSSDQCIFSAQSSIFDSLALLDLDQCIFFVPVLGWKRTERGVQHVRFESPWILKPIVFLVKICRSVEHAALSDGRRESSVGQATSTSLIHHVSIVRQNEQEHTSI